MPELWRRSATELAATIASGEASAVEVIDAHLARIEAVNPHLNAVVRLLADEARVAAAEVDRRRSAGEPLGPLAGVPFTVKENIDVAGHPTTWGLVALADAVVSADSPVVERLRGAGGIPIARTNLPDMGLRIHTDSGLHGLTRNPWHPGRTAGGSSGGEAVALATGMSPLGLGNDLGGSLRNPASCCAVASLKPTTGRIPDAVVVPVEDQPPVFQVMGVQGPMARRVADVRMAFALLAGPHPRDPFSVPAPLDGPDDGRPLRVAVVPEPPGGSTDPAVAARVRAAADVLADAGLEVAEVTPPRYEEAIAVWRALVVGDIRTILPLLEPMLSPDTMTFLTVADDREPPTDLGSYSQAFMQRQSVARAWSLFFTEHDVVLSPTWAQLPFEHGWDVASADNVEATVDLMRPVLPANALGLPAACVPAGLVDGLPVGVQVTAGRFREDRCLDVGEIIETDLAPPVPIDPVRG